MMRWFLLGCAAVLFFSSALTIQRNAELALFKKEDTDREYKQWREDALVKCARHEDVGSLWAWTHWQSDKEVMRCAEMVEEVQQEKVE